MGAGRAPASASRPVPAASSRTSTPIQARVERIRHADITGLPDGTIEGTVNIGDGEPSLEVHGEIDLRTDDPLTSGLYLNGHGDAPRRCPTRSIPAMTPSTEEDPTQPMVVHFAPSESMDIDVDASSACPGTEGGRRGGDGGTACANLQIRNVPTDITATLTNLETESRIEIDAVPGSAAPRSTSSARPPSASSDDPSGNLATGTSCWLRPVHADFSIVGVLEHVSVRMLENEGGDLERIDVRPRQLDFTDGTCTDPEGEIAEVTLGVRNWMERLGEPRRPRRSPARSSSPPSPGAPSRRPR